MKKYYTRLKSIVLRNVRETDADAIYQYRSLGEIARYQYWEPFTMEQTIAFVKQQENAETENGKWIGLIIEKDGIIAGDCAFKIDGNSAEIGCNISPGHQKQGLAKEVLTLLINRLFKDENIKEILAITDSENTASIKLMESAGMIKDPGFVNQLICKGKPCTEIKYRLLKTDWNTRSK